MEKKIIKIKEEYFNRLNELRAEGDAIRNLLNHSIDHFIDMMSVEINTKRTSLFEDIKIKAARRIVERQEHMKDVQNNCLRLFEINERRKIKLQTEIRKEYGCKDTDPISFNYWAPEIWIRQNPEKDIETVTRDKSIHQPTENNLDDNDAPQEDSESVDVGALPKFSGYQPTKNDLDDNNPPNEDAGSFNGHTSNGTGYPKIDDGKGTSL